MQIRYIIILFGLLTGTTCVAQTETLLNIRQEPLSPSEKRYYEISFDVESIVQRGLFANPAFYELLNQRKELLPYRKNRSVISAGYANGKLDGDFLPYEGNASQDMRVTGSGEYSLDSIGTLYGAVQYARGKHNGIGWSAVRHPGLYAPYISTDSIGGNYLFEEYRVKGGFSFQLDKLFLGVSGHFRGEQAHRKTDPRAVNNTTWLNINAGAGWMAGNHLLMLDVGYERNKQHMALRYWRPGQQDRFFVGYGFGLYDVRHSIVTFGYSRMYYISGVRSAFTYLSPTNNSVSIYARLGYQYSRMNTEEADIRDLYFSRTHGLNPVLRVNWDVSASFRFSLLLENNTMLRSGHENIFEQYKVDEINNVYDFRLIDTQSKYKNTVSASQVQLKASYFLSSAHSLELLGGVYHDFRNETYKEEDYKISTTALFPHAGIGYRLNMKHSEWNTSLLYVHKQMLDDTYRVEMKNDIEYLDFQHAFTPYAYYNGGFSSLQLNSTYVYHLKRYGVGLDVKVMFRRGERSSDVSYTKKIGFRSTAPSISPLPDKQDETWFSAMLFVVF